jgi:hypothetical protein
MDEDRFARNDSGLTTDQMLQMILGRLERFPAERFVKMETELQQLRALLLEEIRSRKGLGVDLQRLAREFGEMVDKRIDRGFADCRQDRDLRLSHISERIETVKAREDEDRTMSLRMRLAIFSALAAFLISLINSFIYLLVRR